MSEVHVAIPELMEKGRLECRCIGENAKHTIIEILQHRASEVEQYQKENFVRVAPEISSAVLGWAKMLRELAEKVRDIPTCSER